MDGETILKVIFWAVMVGVAIEKVWSLIKALKEKESTTGRD